MSYKSYIEQGVLYGLINNKTVGIPVNSENKIKVKKLHKCLDCDEIIVMECNRKRCFSCDDKRRSELNNKNRTLRYIEKRKKQKHIYTSKY